jgi:hypothetical protein
VVAVEVVEVVAHPRVQVLQGKVLLVELEAVQQLIMVELVAVVLVQWGLMVLVQVVVMAVLELHLP